jgi:hypothetical protein
VEAKVTEPHVSGIGAVVAMILAIEVKFMEMFTAPIKEELKDVMELREGGSTANQEAPPDERTDTL